MGTTGRGTHIALATALVAIFAALAFYAYGRFAGDEKVGGLEDAREDGIAGAQITLASSSTRSAVAETDMSAPSALQPARPDEARDVSAVGPRVARARACTANDLSGKAAWQGYGDELTGGALVRNSSQSDCLLSSFVRVSFASGPSQLSDAQTGWPLRDLLLPQGQERIVRFSWSNWCAGPLRDPVHVILTLPDGAGYLKVPLINSAGRPQYETPHCVSPGEFSVAKAWW